MATSWNHWARWQRVLVLTGAIVLFFAVATAAAAYGIYATWRESGKIVPHYWIQGEDVGGLTPDFAKQRLQRRFGRLFVTISAPGRDFPLSLAQLGGQLEYDYAIRAAHQYGRSGNLASNLWMFWFSAAEEKRENLPLRWNENTLQKTLWTVGYLYYQKPQDAYLKATGETITVVPEQYGRSMDTAEAAKTVRQRYFPGLRKVRIKGELQKPQIFAAALQGQDVLLGKYSTHFNRGEEGRTTNVHLAAAAVQGTVVMPGNTFSFNHTTGERTPAKGYQVAKIFIHEPGIVKAQIVDGVGGGVCQVSSTLFNAVRSTNGKTGDRLKVVEWNHHSLPVTYVPPGLDATVAWPYKDFRFCNNYSFPIYVRTAVQGSRLTISIWGRIPDADAAQYSVPVKQVSASEDNE